MTGQNNPVLVTPIVIVVGKATEEEKAFAMEAIQAMGASIAGNILAALAALPATAAGKAKTRAISAAPNDELEWINLPNNREYARAWLIEAGKSVRKTEGSEISATALREFKKLWPNLVAEKADLSKVETVETPAE